MATFDKDPNEVLDYGFDWDDSEKPWLVSGDVIDSSTWTADSSNLTIDSSSTTDTVTKVWVSGGVVGETYKLTNNIVTTGGRTGERSHCVVMRDL